MCLRPHSWLVLLLGSLVAHGAYGVVFDDNYVVTWGYNHFTSYQGTEVQISLDNSSGAGFASKLRYGSGSFHMRIKLPPRDCAGVVTAFYLTSVGNNHDELDFEFLGDREGKPYRLQTNVFTNGKGNREQRTLLWFDPSADFHTYTIRWNPHQIVFYVDTTPIRVFKNTNIAGNYPSQPMQIVASIWNGDSWATDGGKTKINWAHAPFRAHFQDFRIDGCPSGPNGIQQCNSPKYWWNNVQYRKLSAAEERVYEMVRQKYVYYDYCADRPRYPVPPPECNL